MRQRSAVLRALRAREAGLDFREVQLEQLREFRDRAAVDTKEPLLLAVSLDERDLFAGATCDLEVAQGLRIDRKQRRRGAVLGAHVAEGRAVGHREARQ